MAREHNENVLYCDTDSLMIKTSDKVIKTGANLGCWDIDKKMDKNSIIEFAALATKDYGFKLENYNRCNNDCQLKTKRSGIPCTEIHNRECSKLKGFRNDNEFEEKVTMENRKNY